MPTKKDIDDFLAQKRIAVVGVSRNSKEYANEIYRALKSRGYSPYPVNPHAKQIEGDRCYANVGEISNTVDGALVILPPAAATQVVRQCAQAGIRRVWLRGGSKDAMAEAIQYCREQGLSVVDGACPMMFLEPIGFAHACHRFFLKITGSLPK